MRTNMVCKAVEHVYGDWKFNPNVSKANALYRYCVYCRRKQVKKEFLIERALQKQRMSRGVIVNQHICMSGY